MAPYHCDSREMTATPAALAPVPHRRRPVVWWALLLASSMLAATVPASAALTTFPAGAYIINMGVVPQTVSNGLRPYGLVYDIVTNSRIPLYWSINPAKSKDGVDFVADGISFSGGSFIVPAEFVINSVVTSINNWKSQGVVVYGPTTSSFTAPVYNTVTYFPRTLIDTANEGLIKPFYDAAGIPTTSYKVGLPSDLTRCIDLYSLPHSDPAWSTHHYLIDYIHAGGYFFSGCHGVSAFENLINPATGQYECAFLSDPRLTLFGDHKDGSPPYNYRDDAHPIMQFMSTLDGATTDGSEQIFMPALGGQWRPTTTLAVWDPTQSDVLSGKSAGPAAAVAYGRAYGDSSCGMALYIGGHDLSGSSTADVAAQRAYLNFLLLSGIDRRPGLSITVPAQMIGGTTAPVIAIASGGTGDYTYQWTSLDGGTFSNSAAATTGFTAPNVGTPTLMVIRCFLTDGPCRRQNFAADTVLVLPAAHVTGTVYEDLNHNEKLDSIETGTGVTGMYAKLVPAAGGAAVRAVAVDPTSGAYDFANIDNGDYSVILDDNSTLNDTTAYLPSGWLGTEHPDQKITGVTVATASVTGLRFGLWHGFTLRGMVFEDNGMGSGVANDGLRNGTEPPLASVEMKATNASDVVYETTSTDDQGSYALWVPYTAVGTAVKVVESGLADYASSGASAGNTGGAYDRASDTVSFTPAVDVQYVNVDFGDVKGISFLPDWQRMVVPGSIIWYAHQFSAGSGGTVTFALSSAQDPAVEGWNQLLYRDMNGDGIYDAGEPAIAGPLTLSAGEKVSVLLRVVVPVNAPLGAIDLTSINATFAYTNSAPVLTSITTRRDCTTVSEHTGLTLTKVPDKTLVTPGQDVTYTITYANTSGNPLKDLVVYDSTLAYTVFVSASHGALPADLTSCNITAPPVGGTGPIVWTFGGSLLTGGTGQLLFTVRVQ